MWSGGGAEGQFYVRIFRLEQQKLVELSASRVAYAHFRKRHLCQARDDNNIYMLGWTPDSEKLFLVAEVYRTNNYREMALFRGYPMDSKTGKVLRVFGEKETNAIKKNSGEAGVVLIPDETENH
jgi:hypothetical protein